MTIRRLALVIALSAAGCGKDTKSEGAKSPPTPTSPDRLAISVTERGFEPNDVRVPAGKPVTIVFTRQTDKTCAKQVVLVMADGTKVEKQLPLDTPVEVAATFPTPGTLGYACGMDMLKGTITVQ